MSDPIAMPFHTCNQDGLKHSVCSHLAVPHAMFMRHGGVSPAPYDSLNCGDRVGDAPEHVTENRTRMARVLGLEGLRTVTQVHGDRIIIHGPQQQTDEEQADAILTDIAGIGLLIQQADCQAVLLHDPVRGVIGAVHSGWRGSVLNILGKTILEMQRTFSCNPDEIQAVISPSLGPCCAEFIHYKKELPAPLHQFHVGNNHIDFWAISRWQLECAGLRSDHIWISRQCTMCNKDYFSYRRSVRNGKMETGRNGSMIGLPSEER